MRRALALMAGVLGLAGALAWGCATSDQSVVSSAPTHDWQHYEPDAGWASYVPAHHEFAPNPMDSLTGVNAHSGAIPIVPSGRTKASFP